MLLDKLRIIFFFFALYTKLEKLRKQDNKSAMTIEKFNVKMELSSPKSLKGKRTSNFNYYCMRL